MWIQKESVEWNIIPYHAEFYENADIKKFTVALFGQAKRLSSTVISDRCEEFGRTGTFPRARMRLAMQIAQGYDNGAGDRWRGSHRVGQYMNDIKEIRFLDEPKNKKSKK